MDKQKAKKCLGRFETTYMRTMTAPAPSDYAPRKKDHGQYTKILNKIEMNKKFQFPSSISKYKYEYCGEKYPVAGEQKSGKSRKSVLNYKPSCPQYAPYHSKTQDMSLILRRLDSQPEHEHTWYKDKKPPKSARSQKPSDSTGEKEERRPERSWNRLQCVQEEHEMQDDPRTVMGPYYDRLKPPPEPKIRTKMPKFVEKKKVHPPRPPRQHEPMLQSDRIIPDTSRSSREPTTYGFYNSMTMRAATMIKPPEKDPREKPKHGVSTFFSRGSSELTSENGTAMAEVYYAHQRPYGGALFTLAADKALASRYL